MPCGGPSRAIAKALGVVEVVGQVVGVQRHPPARGLVLDQGVERDGRRDHGVAAQDQVRAGYAGGVADVQLVLVGGAARDRQALDPAAELVGGPDVGRIGRDLQHRRAGGHRIGDADQGRAGADQILDHLGVEVGVAGVEGPGHGDLAGQAELHALDALLLARLSRDLARGRVGLLGVVLLHLEDGAADAQAVVQQAELGAGLVGLAQVGREHGVGSRDRGRRADDARAHRRRRLAVGQVVGLLRVRFIDQRGVRAGQARHRLELLPGGVDQGVAVLGLVVLVAHAGDQRDLRA